jgi:hypothetical protein
MNSGAEVMDGFWMGSADALRCNPMKNWWAVRASNPRPSGCKPDALTN